MLVMRMWRHLFMVCISVSFLLFNILDLKIRWSKPQYSVTTATIFGFSRSETRSAGMLNFIAIVFIGFMACPQWHLFSWVKIYNFWFWKFELFSSYYINVAYHWKNSVNFKTLKFLERSDNLDAGIMMKYILLI